MIRVEDVIIGAVLKTAKGEIIRVESITTSHKRKVGFRREGDNHLHYARLASCEGVPLTDDILTESGWKKEMRYGYVLEKYECGIYHKYDGEEGFSIIGGMVNQKPCQLQLAEPIRCIHELQASFARCGMYEKIRNIHNQTIEI